jgi:hypothetical protein
MYEMKDASNLRCMPFRNVEHRGDRRNNPNSVLVFRGRGFSLPTSQNIGDPGATRRFVRYLRQGDVFRSRKENKSRIEALLVRRKMAKIPASNNRAMDSS